MKTRLLKLILLALFIIILTAPAFARQSQIAEDSTLRIDLAEYNPSPIAAGESSALTFEIRNLGSKEIKLFQLQAVDKFPFEVVGNTTVQIKSLKPLQSETFKFMVQVSKDIDSGIYPFAIQYIPVESDFYTSALFNITVKRMSRTTASTLVKISPEQIKPGDKAEIEISIENIATYAMKDVTVKLNFTDSVPIVPYSSTSEKQIKLISPGTFSSVAFPIIAKPDAAAGAYKLLIKMTYDDELGNENTREEWIGVLIGSAPDYIMNIEDSKPVKNTPSKITASISNTGPSDIKYLVIELLNTEDYAVVGQSRAYLGNVEPDDYETEEFEIIPKKSGILELEFNLRYKDAFNQEKTEIAKADVNVLSKSKARSMGLIPKSKLSRIIIYIILIIFLYLAYKHWKVHKNIPNALKHSLLAMLSFILRIIRSIRLRNIKRIPHKIRLFLIRLQ